MAGSNFEMQLGQLADAEISQNAPALTRFKIGFQLIDKDDDDTKGCGVSVYNVDSQWVYIPVFFVNSRIRGIDMMFLPDRKQFLPCREGWITYLRNKKPLTLGEPVSEDERKRYGSGKPQSVRLWDRRTPFYKTASDCSIVEDDALDSMFCMEQETGDPFSLNTWIPRLGKEAAAVFINGINSNPDFANSILEHYSPQQITDMVTNAFAEPAISKTASEPELKIYYALTKEAAELSDSNKELLMKDGVYIEDNRKNTSIVFHNNVDMNKLSTPTSDGKYEVLMADGSFKTFYAMFPSGTRKHTCAGQTSSEILSSSPSKYILVPEDNKSIYVGGSPLVQAAKIPLTDEAFLKELPSIGKSVKHLTKSRAYTEVVIFDGEGRAYRVNIHSPTILNSTKLICNRNAALNVPHYEGNQQVLGIRDIDTLVFTEKDGKLFYNAGTLYVPNGCKIIELAEHVDELKYAFGSSSTITALIHSKAGLTPLTIRKNSDQIFIEGKGSDKSKSLKKEAAIVELVTKHGITAPEAKHMVKTAASKRYGGTDSYLIKYAEAGVISQVTEGAAQDLPRAPLELKYEHVGGRSALDFQDIQKASDAGVKEVMDVSVLRNLAKSVRALDSLKDYIPDLLGGLDKLGKLLFLFYWHNKLFKDRYGSEDLVELEESLRDTFNMLGDLLLFLIQKTASSDGALNSVSGELSKDLNS